MVVPVYVRAAKFRATKVNLDLISCENSVYFCITTQYSLEYSVRVEYLAKPPAVYDSTNIATEKSSASPSRRETTLRHP